MYCQSNIVAKIGGLTSTKIQTGVELTKNWGWSDGGLWKVALTDKIFTK